MKTIKNTFLTILTVLLANALFVSCSSDNEVNPKTYKYTYNIGETNLSERITNFQRDNEEDLNFKCTLNTDIQIPESIIKSNNSKQLEQFLLEHSEDFSGEILFYLNNNLDAQFEVINGNEEMVYRAEPYPKRGECSFEGVRQCTQHSIYVEMNTFEKLVCAFEGFACVEMEMISCYAENCLGA